jgi:hypothetical protein
VEISGRAESVFVPDCWRYRESTLAVVERQERHSLSIGDNDGFEDFDCSALDLLLSFLLSSAWGDKLMPGEAGFW